MTKITTRVSKKVPVRGIENSSREFAAEASIEIDDDDPITISMKTDELFTALRDAVDMQAQAGCPRCEGRG